MSDKLRMPLSRMGYKHISGKVYVVWGCADTFTDKQHPDNKPIVIMTSMDDGSPLYYPLDRFFDKHPQTGEERFQLVTPK